MLGRAVTRRWLVFLGIAVVVGVAALIALSTVADPPPESGGVAIVGGVLPLLAAGDVDAAVGQPAPQLSGVDFNGDAVVAPRTGAATLLLFLAHWCPHCQVEVPVLSEWHDGGGTLPGVEIMSVATSTDPARPNYPPDDWLAREGWAYPVLVDDGGFSAAHAYGLTAFPFWVLVDGSGTVLWRGTGELSPADLEALVGAFNP